MREDRSGQPAVYTCAAKQTHLETGDVPGWTDLLGAVKLPGLIVAARLAALFGASYPVHCGTVCHQGICFAASGMRQMTIRNSCDSSSGQPLVRNDVICRQLSLYRYLK